MALFSVQVFPAYVLPTRMESDWLEVKMETDESPDPTHSQPESSPEISPHGTPPTNTASVHILSPPAAFADTSSPFSSPSQQSHHSHVFSRLSQQQQQQALDTASKLRNRASGSPLTPQNRRRLRANCRTNRRSSGAASAARTNDLSSPLGCGGAVAAVSTWTSPAVLATDSLFSCPSPAWNVTATPNDNTDNDSSPSIMATASMLNSTYAIRTPGSSALFQTHHRQSLLRATPTIVMTDSVMGNSPFTVPAASSTTAAFLQSGGTRTTIHTNSNRTPSITATDSLMGNSPFAVRTPSSVTGSPSLSSRTAHNTCAKAVLMGDSPFRASLSSSTTRTPVSSPSAAAAPTRVTMTTPVGPTVSSADFSSSAAVQPSSSCLTSGGAVQHKAGTPMIVASTFVMGDSTMSSPTSGTPCILSSASLGATSPIMTSPSPIMTSPSPTPLRALPSTTTTTVQTTSDGVLPANCERGDCEVMEVTVDSGSEPCDQRPAPSPREQHAANGRRDLTDTFRTHQGKLNEELQVIKGQFFNLLDDLGFSHDIYYKQTNQTPADTSRQCQHHVTADPISQSVQDLHTSVNISATSVVPGDRKAGGMSTPRSTTPRRGTFTGRQRVTDNMRSMYADLLIDQLLAQAQTDSSDTSNSPPEPDNVSGETNFISAAATIPCDCEQGSPLLSYNVQAAPSCVWSSSAHNDHAVSVNINRGAEDTPTKGSARSKNIAALGLLETKGKNCALSDTPVMLLTAGSDHGVLRPAASGLTPSRSGGLPNEDTQEGEQTIMVSQAVSNSANESGSSAPTTSTSSSNRSVPDLEKELVSRIQYYSDFTIDRQKKIDEAIEIPESGDSQSPTTVSTQNSNDISNESISHRCVEGSETPSHPRLVSVAGGRPQIVSLRTVQVSVPPHTTVSTKTGSSSKDNSRNCLHKGKSQQSHHSSDLYESDTSSGTGSMPRSQQSSSRHSSRHTSSSRDRHDWHPNGICSSSAERRSSSSSSRGSRASRCSSHPLASSTLISDPSSHSGSLKSSTGSRNKSGSVYTWSLENSSDENLHTSYLRSSEKQHRRSRKSRHQRSMAKTRDSHQHAHTGRSSSRPATLIGADSPPDQRGPDGGGTNATLHLTHMVSVIDDSTPTRHFGGCSFENSALPPTPRSSSLPRTSTRIGGLLFADNVCNSSPHKKASSFPELSSNPWILTGHPSQDLNCAISRIGPSNLSSGLHGTSDNPSGSGQSESGRPTVTGKSSSASESAGSFYSQCSTCNPTPSRLLVSPSGSRKLTLDLTDQDEILDEILTNSPHSYDSSGVQAPYNSYTSPAGSATNDYTTVSDSSSEVSAADLTITTASSNHRGDFAVKTSNSGVFKVPYIPAARSVRRGKVGGHPTHSVGVRAVGTGTPHVPFGLVRHKEPASRRKLFNIAAPANQAQPQPSGNFLRAPKITDRKALVRKFKKFSSHFKKDKDSAKIHTLATL